MEKERYSELLKFVKKFIPSERIITDYLRRFTYGTDASFYRLTPKIIFKVESEDEVKQIVSKCNELKIPVTFRAAGTSLSGQAITDSVLIMLGTKWRGFEISEDASRIKLQPGVIGEHANIYLKKYNKKIGPDPASIKSAMIGGIAANNASGMCCGIDKNTYKTVSSMKIIFADGSEFNTSDPKSIQSYKDKNQSLINSIVQIKNEIEDNAELKNLIIQKYKIKNTTGYSLNSLIDYDDPIKIIEHLMIGSEGTLGFISEITYNTVNDFSNKSTALIIFKNIYDACKAIEFLKPLNIDAAEIMDRASLRSVENKEGVPDYLKILPKASTALLIEIKDENDDKLNLKIKAVKTVLAHFELELPFDFTSDENHYKKLWDIRKGLFPSIGAMRKTGTTVIIEDIAFDIKYIAEAVLELQKLFHIHRYYDAIIFGHALDGNIHFVFKQNFNFEKEILRYKFFMDDIVKLVNKFHGSLKAEHGTGRNIAPFVEKEWGSTAYSIMKRIKKVFDPNNILNPGVLINNNKNAHLENLKPLTPANEIIDKCIECGFCEVICPSKDLTLTPRQRIVALREIANLKNKNNDPQLLQEMLDDFEYEGNETCAVDGLCAEACPISIDTGKVIKLIRNYSHSTTSETIANIASNHYSLILNTLKKILSVVNLIEIVLSEKTLKNISKILRKISSNKIPEWNKNLPRTSQQLTKGKLISENKIVYFPSCINRTFGNNSFADSEKQLSEIMVELFEKAGYEILYPENISDLCCGLPFSSKGFIKQADKKSVQLLDKFLQISNNGKYPICFDMSPCVYRIKEFLSYNKDEKYKRLRIYDAVEFAEKYLIKNLEIEKSDKKIALHPVCSLIKMGLTNSFENIGKLCAEEVIIPVNTKCCGFAGDKGFTHPELNKSALNYLEKELDENYEHGYSTSRTCEIGLSENSGINYKSIMILLNECSKPKIRF